MPTRRESTVGTSESLENLEAAAKSHATAKIESATKIAAARENLVSVENYQKAAENLAKLARDGAIQAAYANGVSVSAICRAIGTSNRHTVYAIVASTSVNAPTTAEAPEIQTPSTTGTPTVENVPNTRAGKPGWLLTWSDGGSVEVYRKGDGELTAIGAGRDRWLADPTLANLIKEPSA